MCNLHSVGYAWCNLVSDLRNRYLLVAAPGRLRTRNHDGCVEQHGSRLGYQLTIAYAFDQSVCCVSQARTCIIEVVHVSHAHLTRLLKTWVEQRLEGN